MHQGVPGQFCNLRLRKSPARGMVTGLTCRRSARELVTHVEVIDEHVDLSAARLVVMELAPVNAEGVNPEYTTECLAVNRQLPLPPTPLQDGSWPAHP